MTVTRRAFVGMVGMLPLLSFAQKGSAGYPSRPVRLVVPFSPGGGTDNTARMLGAELSKAIGQSVVVENRAGAGGNIATELVARSAPDGHTLLMVTNGQLIANPIGMKMNFNPEQEIALLGRVTSAPLLVVVSPDSSYKTINDLISQAKARKEGINYGSAGLGTPQHLGMEQFKSVAGFSATHVPYKGSGPALMDLMAGRLDVVMDSFAAAMPHINSGKLRVLAVTAEEPLAVLPGIPTLTEHVPGVSLASWVGVGAPAGVSQEVATFLSEALGRIVTDPSFIEQLRAQNGIASWLDAAAFTAAVSAERKVTEVVMRQANITLE